MKRVLITGGSGFIGHHLVDYLLQETDWELVVLDRLDISGDLGRLADLESVQGSDRISFVWHDLKSAIDGFVAERIGDIDYIIHLAAASHVDRSIADPMSFIQDNVVGTTNLLNFARELDVDCFLNFSTDETVGPAPDGYFHTEDDPHRPSNPYAASKAGQEDIGYAFYVTYGLPVITTRTMNNFGEGQHPEKLIPKAARYIEEQKVMPIHAEEKDGEWVSIGIRTWIYAKETARAIKFLIENGEAGEYYNIVGIEELNNLEVCQAVAEFVGKPLHYKFVDFHEARPGHDRRYALSGDKLRNMGWEPEMSFQENLKRTIENERLA